MGAWAPSSPQFGKLSSNPLPQRLCKRRLLFAVGMVVDVDVEAPPAARRDARGELLVRLAQHPRLRILEGLAIFIQLVRKGRQTLVPFQWRGELVQKGIRHGGSRLQSAQVFDHQERCTVDREDYSQQELYKAAHLNPQGSYAQENLEEDVGRENGQT